MPTAISSRIASAAAESGMPVAASAKIGTATPAETGCRRCWNRRWGRLALRPGPDRREQAEQDAGDGGVDAAGVDADPGDDRERPQQQPGSTRRLQRQPVGAGRQQPAGEPGRRQVRVNRTAISAIASRSSTTAIESSSTRTPDGQRGPTSASTPSANAMSVATGIAHAPSSRGRAARDGERDERGHDHAADGGEDRQRGGAAVGQFADDQLALELEPGDEEEDGQQPVRGPVAERQVQVQPLRPDRGRRIPDGAIAALGDVGPEQSERRGDQQEPPARGLLTQEVGEVVGTENESLESGSGRWLPTRLPGAPSAEFRWDRPRRGASAGAGSRRTAPRRGRGDRGSSWRGGAAATRPRHAPSAAGRASGSGGAIMRVASRWARSGSENACPHHRNAWATRSPAARQRARGARRRRAAIASKSGVRWAISAAWPARASAASSSSRRISPPRSAMPQIAPSRNCRRTFCGRRSGTQPPDIIAAATSESPARRGAPPPIPLPGAGDRARRRRRRR